MKTSVNSMCGTHFHCISLPRHWKMLVNATSHTNTGCRGKTPEKQFQWALLIQWLYLLNSSWWKWVVEVEKWTGKCHMAALMETSSLCWTSKIRPSSNRPYQAIVFKKFVDGKIYKKRNPQWIKERMGFYHQDESDVKGWYEEFISEESSPSRCF